MGARLNYRRIGANPTGDDRTDLPANIDPIQPPKGNDTPDSPGVENVGVSPAVRKEDAPRPSKEAVSREVEQLVKQIAKLEKLASAGKKKQVLKQLAPLLEPNALKIATSVRIKEAALRVLDKIEYETNDPVHQLHYAFRQAIRFTGFDNHERTYVRSVFHDALLNGRFVPALYNGTNTGATIVVALRSIGVLSPDDDATLEPAATHRIEKHFVAQFERVALGEAFLCGVHALFGEVQKEVRARGVMVLADEDAAAARPLAGMSRVDLSQQLNRYLEVVLRSEVSQPAKGWRRETLFEQDPMMQSIAAAYWVLERVMKTSQAIANGTADVSQLALWSKLKPEDQRLALSAFSAAWDSYARSDRQGMDFVERMMNNGTVALTFPLGMHDWLWAQGHHGGSQKYVAQTLLNSHGELVDLGRASIDRFVRDSMTWAPDHWVSKAHPDHASATLRHASRPSDVGVRSGCPFFFGGEESQRRVLGEEQREPVFKSEAGLSNLRSWRSHYDSSQLGLITETLAKLGIGSGSPPFAMVQPQREITGDPSTVKTLEGAPFTPLDAALLADGGANLTVERSDPYVEHQGREAVPTIQIENYRGGRTDMASGPVVDVRVEGDAKIFTFWNFHTGRAYEVAFPTDDLSVTPQRVQSTLPGIIQAKDWTIADVQAFLRPPNTDLPGLSPRLCWSEDAGSMRMSRAEMLRSIQEICAICVDIADPELRRDAALYYLERLSALYDITDFTPSRHAFTGETHGISRSFHDDDKDRGTLVVWVGANGDLGIWSSDGTFGGHPSETWSERYIRFDAEPDLAALRWLTP